MSFLPSPDHRTQSELIAELRQGTHEDQERALNRLGAVGDAESLDAIIQYLQDQPDGATSAALDAIRILGLKYTPGDRYGMADVLLPFLSSEDWSQRLIAARLFNTHPSELAGGRLRELVQEALEKMVSEQNNRFSAVRMLAERTLAESIMAMASCGRLMALPDILKFLEDSALKPLATRALGLIGSETERPHLEDLTEDEDFRVRDAAQWSLGLMDERIEMLTNPPDQIPEPPPDRLNPIYWIHRQLFADDDELYQFLVVRVVIEHLLLDAFLNEGRVPEECQIILRRYEGAEPPELRLNRAETIKTWQYHLHGPDLAEVENSTLPGPMQLLRMRASGKASVVISYPASLKDSGEGLVSFDCLINPYFGRGWIYHISKKNGEWVFSLVRRSWSS